MLSFDVVIPSLFADLDSLAPVISVASNRADVTLRFYVIVDNPRPIPTRLTAAAAAREDLELVHVGRNEGAGAARNRGVDAGHGDFILFLDDDVVPEPGLLDAYVDAIGRDSGCAPGYVGVTQFPKPTSSFTRGIVASDILTFFDLGADRDSLAWSVTANLCLRRSALDKVRFCDMFPKAGGGEDIDVCLRLHGTGSLEPFISVPDAVVRHPWWNGGRRSYKRFARWAFGDGRLPTLHPRFCYLNFPTLPEVLFVAGLMLPAGPMGWSARGLFKLVAAGLLVEFGVDYAKLAARGQRVSLSTSMEATVVRLSNDAGRLVGNLSRGRPQAIGERFDYFCTGESIRYERRVAATKSAALLVLVSAARLLDRR